MLPMKKHVTWWFNTVGGNGKGNGNRRSTGNYEVSENQMIKAGVDIQMGKEFTPAFG